MISEPADLVAAEEPATARPGILPMRVLLVEDDEGDAFLVRELLLDAGSDIDLVRVRSLAEAPARCGADVDCVLLDLGLPDATGLDGLRQRARAVAEHRRAGADRSRRRAPRHRGGRRRRPGLPGQGQHRRAAADPGDPLRRRAQARRRVGPPAVRQPRRAPPRTPDWSAACCPSRWCATTGVRVVAALPARAAPVGARRRLLRRGRVRRRRRLRADRRRRRARPGRGGARGLPADRLAHAGPRRGRSGRRSSAPWTPCWSASAATDEVFATVAMVRLDRADRMLRLWLAGHPLPLLLAGTDGRCPRRSGSPAWRSASSTVTPGRRSTARSATGHLAAAVHRRPDRGLRRPPGRPTARGAGAVRDAGRAAGARPGPRRCCWTSC